MKLFRRSSLLALAFALAFALPLSPLHVWLGAQQAAQAPKPAMAMAPATPPSAGGKRAMDIEDVIAFRNMGATSLSPDGQWLAYSMRPTQGDTDVFVRSTSSDKEMKFPVGDGGGNTMVFSEDSQWVAFSTSAKKADADAARRASRPAAQGGMTLVNLATGEKKDIAKIRRFAFNGDLGGWIALHRFGADPSTGSGQVPAGGAAGGRPGGPGRGGAAGGGTAGDTRPKGTDLVLHELKTGTEINVGNVSEFTFNKSGKTLAMVIDAADQAGNGVQLRDMASGVVTSLDTDKAFYERLGFTDEGDALLVLKGHDETTAWKDRLFAVVGWTGFGNAAPKKVMFDPSKDTSFPKEMSISNNRTPTWT